MHEFQAGPSGAFFLDLLEQQDRKFNIESKSSFGSRIRPQLLVGMIRHGCAMVSRRPTPGTKSNGATVADQYDPADNCCHAVFAALGEEG